MAAKSANHDRRSSSLAFGYTNFNTMAQKAHSPVFVFTVQSLFFTVQSSFFTVQSSFSHSPVFVFYSPVFVSHTVQSSVFGQSSLRFSQSSLQFFRQSSLHFLDSPVSTSLRVQQCNLATGLAAKPVIRATSSCLQTPAAILNYLVW